MFEVSTAFTEQTAAATQRVLARVDVCDLTGAVLYSAAATLDGSVEEDSSRSVRRSCQVSFVDEAGDLTPRSMRDLLAPVGHELRVYRGLRIPSQVVVSGGGGGGDTYSDTYSDTYGDSYTGPTTVQVVTTDEWVPLGVFGISRPEMSSADAAAVITVAGYDRARRISRARLSDVYTIAAGTDLAAAVQAMLVDRWPGCPALVSTLDDPATISHRAVYDVLTDPWQALTDLATSFGAELFFDETGVPLLRDIPDPATSTPVADYQRGLASVVTSIQRALDDEQTFSGVLAVGESTSAQAPVRGLVWDSNPLSPTYADGDFGYVVYDYTSSFLTTQTQCESTARKLLPKVTGVLEETAYEMVPNPALQCGDTVTCTDAKLGVDGLFSIERVVHPLAATGVQQVSMKARKVRS